MFSKSSFCFVFIFVLWLVMIPGFSSGLGDELAEGVRPLQVIQDDSWESLITKDTLFLNDPATVESFLKELESHPPDWKYLYGSDVDERYDRLFAEMEKRDAVRIGHPMLKQRIAFLWHGSLTSYRPQHKGFGIAIGPAKIKTSWGIVRFKIAKDPFEMVGIPPANTLEAIQERRGKGESVDVTILYQGTLIPEESLLYDFSTETEGEGMILPIVSLEQVDYVWSP